MNRNEFIQSHDQTSGYFLEKILEHLDETLPRAREEEKMIKAKETFNRLFSLAIKENHNTIKK